MNPALHSTTMGEDVDEFGIIPLLIAAASVVPSVLQSQSAGKDAKAQKRAQLAQQAAEKKQREADQKRRNTMLLVGGGIAVLLLTGTTIFVATRKRKKR